MNKFFNFKTLVSFSALIIAGCAALFSVTGIGTLFAGAQVSAIVMASALELGKLVGISFLYRYWNEVPKALKNYMLVASIILMVITSAGIYGYLSSAYAKVAATPLKMNADIQIYNSQISTLDEEIKRKTARLDQIISLRGQQENRIDNLIGKSETGTNTSIRSAQNSLSELNRTATDLQKEINKLEAEGTDEAKAKAEEEKQAARATAEEKRAAKNAGKNLTVEKEPEEELKSENEQSNKDTDDKKGKNKLED